MRAQAVSGVSAGLSLTASGTLGYTRAMPIPTEPIGSIPRPPQLIDAMRDLEGGRITRANFEAVCEGALRDTLQRFEATGSPVITDGEQAKPSFATYPIHGLSNLAPDGVKIEFADGHVRQLPKLI